MSPTLAALAAGLCLLAAGSALADTAPATAIVPSPAGEPPAGPAPRTPPGARLDAGIDTRKAPSAARPDDPGACVARGDALMQRSRDRAEPRLFAEAEAAYGRALEQDAGSVGAMVGMAWVANSRHDFDAGRRWARAALALDPRLPDAFALLGDAAMEAGDYDEAMDHFQACLDLRPDLSAYARSAHLLWLTGDARRAKALLLKAIHSGAPHMENIAWCRAELALMMFHDGALPMARGQVEAALREAPEHPHVLAAAGRLSMAAKEYPEAIRLYERAAAITPLPSILASLADLHEITGNPRKAAEALARLESAQGSHGHVHGPAPGSPAPAGAAPTPPPADSLPGREPHSHGSTELARFLADHDRDLDRALREAEEAHRASRSVHVTDTLAWCYHRKGLDVDALRTIRRALRWNTPDATLHFHAGMIHARLGDRANAQRHLAQALSLNPAFHPVQSDIATRALAGLASARTAAETAEAAESAFREGRKPVLVTAVD